MFRKIFKIRFTTFLFFVVVTFVTTMLIVSIPITDDPLNKAMDSFYNANGSIHMTGRMTSGDMLPVPHERFDTQSSNGGYIFRFDGIEVILLHYELQADYNASIQASKIKHVRSEFDTCDCDFYQGDCDYCDLELNCEDCDCPMIVFGKKFEDHEMKSGAGGILVLITRSENVKAIEIFRGIKI